MEVTQAQLDAMIASGEVSLTPPAVNDETTPAPATPAGTPPAVAPIETAPLETAPQEKETDAEEGLGYTPVKEREYTLPTPRPSRIPVNSKRYYAETKRITKLADKITDPEFANKAIDILGSGADYRDINKAVKILAEQDRARKANLAREEKRKIAALKREAQVNMTQTRDRKKTKETYAQSAGAYGNMGTLLQRLTDNYQDDFVGWLDASYNDTATVAPLPQEKGAGTYKQDFDAIFLLSKDANNMGANFTKGEQSMLRATMPDMSEKEDVYKKKLTNYIRTLRDITAEKLQASKDAGYNVGKLQRVAKQLGGAYENALNKFGLKDEDIFKADGANSQTQESGFVSLRPKAKEPTPSTPEKSVVPVSREDLEDGRVKVTFSDGSVKYAKRR